MLPVLAAQRQAQVELYVLTHRWATVRELALALGASQTTIRRDLDALAKRGAVTRVHGGAGTTAASA